MTRLYGYSLPNGLPAKVGDPVELVAVTEHMTLFDPPAPVVEPSSCTGVAHTHRWIRFGPAGQKQIAVVDIDADGIATFSEQAIDQLLKGAGFVPADPTPVEEAAARRLSWARSRLQDALNRRAR